MNSFDCAIANLYTVKMVALKHYLNKRVCFCVCFKSMLICDLQQNHVKELHENPLLPVDGISARHSQGCTATHSKDVLHEDA